MSEIGENTPSKLANLASKAINLFRRKPAGHEILSTGEEMSVNQQHYDQVHDRFRHRSPEDPELIRRWSEKLGHYTTEIDSILTSRLGLKRSLDNQAVDFLLHYRGGVAEATKSPYFDPKLPEGCVYPEGVNIYDRDRSWIEFVFKAMTGTKIDSLLFFQVNHPGNNRLNLFEKSRLRWKSSFKVQNSPLTKSFQFTTIPNPEYGYYSAECSIYQSRGFEMLASLLKRDFRAGMSSEITPLSLLTHNGNKSYGSLIGIYAGLDAEGNVSLSEISFSSPWAKELHSGTPLASEQTLKGVLDGNRIIWDMRHFIKYKKAVKPSTLENLATISEDRVTVVDPSGNTQVLPLLTNLEKYTPTGFGIDGKEVAAYHTSSQTNRLPSGE